VELMHAVWKRALFVKVTALVITPVLTTRLSTVNY
jgi:hypothetical protein